MGIRPGDSAPRFEDIDPVDVPPALSFGRESSLEDDDDAAAPPLRDAAHNAPSRDPEAMPGFDESALSDSHILGGRAMVPHYSDGSTDILKRGWDQEESTTPEAPFLPVDESPPLDPESTASQPEATGDDPIAAEPVDRDTETLRDEIGRAETDVPPFDAAGSVNSNDPENAPSGESAATVEPSAFEFNSTPLATTAAPATPRSTRSTPPKKANLGMVLIASVLSALTIGFGLLKWRDSAVASHSSQLANLPDPDDHENSVKLYPRDVPLPIEHVFKIGDSRAIGDIRVEVLRVTHQSMAYQHYSGDPKQKHENSAPVLQLWLRLTNLTTNTDIAPLDYNLVFKQVLNAKDERISNTFLCEHQQQAQGPLHLMFERPEHPLWDMVGMSLGHELKPGESMETFIPSTEETATVFTDGQSGKSLVWRIHLRKGYDEQGKGVTTLIEVVFPASEIQKIVDGPPPSATSASPPTSRNKKKPVDAAQQ